MSTMLTLLEEQRNHLTEEVFDAIKHIPFNPFRVQASSARLARVNRLISYEAQSDASSADPLEVTI